MLQANAEFIPNLSQETVHLRALTQKHKCFKWSVACVKEFECLKTLFHEDALLHYFDPDLPTYLFVGAHKSGLSAILSQGPSPDKARIVACASRTTAPVKWRYLQLDLEALSIDFTLCFYHQDIVGGPEVTVFTDYKPLVNKFKSHCKGYVCTDRIQLCHQDVHFKVLWHAGKDNPADFLSCCATPFKKIP